MNPEYRLGNDTKVEGHGYPKDFCFWHYCGDSGGHDYRVEAPLRLAPRIYIPTKEDPEP
jgi:hypothetical protein